MERPERPRMRRPTNTSSDDDASSSNVSWDDLGDSLSFARRASMSSGAARSHQSLPTIYASGKSTRDVTTGIGDDGDDDDDDDMPQRSASMGHVSTASSHIPDDEQHEGQHPHHQHQLHQHEEQHEHKGSPPPPRPRRQNRNHAPTKLNHSLRKSDTTWDDLEDEIGRALKQSMMVGADATASGSDYASEAEGATSTAAASAAASAGGGGEEDDNGPWNCPACTFLNDNPLHLVCAICGTAKVVGKLPEPSEAPAAPPPAAPIASPPPPPGHQQHGSYHSEDQLDGSYGRQQNNQNQNNLKGSFSGGSIRGGYNNGRRVTSDYDDGDRRGGNNNNNNNNRRGGGGQYYEDEQDDFRSSFNSHQQRHQNRNGNNGYGDEHLRNSTGSHNSRSSRGSRGMGQSTRRRGVRRGDQRQSRSAGGLDGSMRSMAQSEQSLNDSFGSFNSQDYQLHSFKPRGGGGGGNIGGGRGGERKYSRSVSGGASVASHRSHRSGSGRSRRSTLESGGGNKYDNDNMSRASSSRRSQRRSTKQDHYRRSTSDLDHDFHNHGNNGYQSYEDSGDSGNRDARIGGRIDAGSVGTESDCSDLSDEESHYRDDRTQATRRTVKALRVPQGEVTIIYTDVQGSTSLWEADPLAMKKSTDLHDSIIRKCYADHGGYEITTEGDAFNLAFQHPADAIGFALKAQLSLNRAKWPEGILNHPDGCDNEKKKFRGFRVRMGMHHGPTTSNVHETTGRTIYQGEAVNISKAIEKMSHGGQILTTVETWRAVSGMAEQFLGSPQVMDCGEHLLYDPKKENNAAGDKKKKTKRIVSKRIVQLVPNSLSYDFFAARGGQEVKEGEQPARVCGRVFPPLLSHGQLSTSFLNAPYIGNRVAMVFVYTDKMESVTDKERKKNFKILSKYVRSHLMRLSPPGYECQEDKGSWMLAFDRIENGIKFGLDLKEDVIKHSDLFGDVDKERAFRIGIHWGWFLSMGPHTVSGHADYFGPIVNRAARVAAQCEPGQVCVGVPMGDGEEPPDPGPSVEVDVLGVKQLKGISIEMAIFACRKRKPKS